MLKIKAEQIRFFQTDADEAFVRRVTEYLRENHSEAEARISGDKKTVVEISDETLREMVRGGIKRAEKHGISWKSTLLSFVVLMFLAAPNFDEHPKSVAFFSQNETITDENFEAFLDEMTDEDWETVENNYDETVWSI